MALHLTLLYFVSLPKRIQGVGKAYVYGEGAERAGNRPHCSAAPFIFCYLTSMIENTLQGFLPCRVFSIDMGLGLVDDLCFYFDALS